ncbi:MAG: MerR family transcriptional regulator [Brevefilum sp.]|nr:MerR family transcriptional regulator [Brevefilum sp.]
MTENLSIEDLEKHSGLPVRTLHYYMAEGLLPGPDKRGKNASYSQEHLDRLDLILILKELHLPLKEIRDLLENMTPAEIQHYLDDQEDLLVKLKAAQPDDVSSSWDTEGSSALEYIKGLEEAHGMINEIRSDQTYYPQRLRLENNRFDRESIGLDMAAAQPQEERWRRMVLADGIELHTRETRDKETLHKIKRLLSFARSLFTK